MIILRRSLVSIQLALLVAFTAFSLSGCGQIDRSIASVTGSSKSCIDGVTYLQFTSGVTVQYDRASKVVSC